MFIIENRKNVLPAKIFEYQYFFFLPSIITHEKRE